MIDSGTKLPENRIHLFDPVGLINDTYGTYGAANYGIRAQRTAKSFDSFANNNSGGLRFVVETMVEDESNGSSPRLWNTSPPTSPKTAASPLHNQTMSPTSRTQAIARGQRELMEMIRDMPESFYELSLKDIVEQKTAISAQHEDKMEEEKKFANKIDHSMDKRQKKSCKKITKSESKAKMIRSGSIEKGGLLLKTSVFPISLGTRKSKKSLANTASFKIAPKPPPAPNGPIKGTEKDWWRRRSCIASESESGGLSSNSGSASSRSSSSGGGSRWRHSARFLPSCCTFKEKRITAKK